MKKLILFSLSTIAFSSIYCMEKQPEKKPLWDNAKTALELCKRMSDIINQCTTFQPSLDNLTQIEQAATTLGSVARNIVVELDHTDQFKPQRIEINLLRMNTDYVRDNIVKFSKYLSKNHEMIGRDSSDAYTDLLAVFIRNIGELRNRALQLQQPLDELAHGKLPEGHPLQKVLDHIKANCTCGAAHLLNSTEK